ncbi:MAG: amidohydrolase [Chloroflexi bacterium]|nr:amidohydrolase [Chloroflexota bacterium]
MIVDSHTHIFAPAVRENRERYLEADAIFAELYDRKSAKIATAEELVGSMDADGVDISVAAGFPWSSDRLCFEGNDYLIESAARHPGRLIPFCSVPPMSENAAAEVRRCAGRGARGIGELRLDREWLDSEPFRRFAQSMVAERLVLLVHSSEPVGHRYPGKGETGPDVLYGLAVRFPELKIVCAHWGGGLPFYTLMPEVSQALANVYFDSAASPFLYRPEISAEVGRLAGMDKVLFGSDYPLISQRRVLKEIESGALDGTAREMITGGNARRLLGIT